MHLKFYLTCSQCQKILNKPILLPCGDTICKEHLHEKKVLKENLITCKICKQEFHDVKSNEFKSNNLVAKQIEDEIFLSENEKKLKQKIEDSFRIIHHLNEQLYERKVSADLNSFEHFQEIRRLIDLHREESILNNNGNENDNLNKVSLDMIDKTLKMEQVFLKKSETIFNLKDVIRIDSEVGIQEFLKETFRYPNLTLDILISYCYRVRFSSVLPLSSPTVPNPYTTLSLRF
jgi:hypothetical protein